MCEESADSCVSRFRQSGMLILSGRVHRYPSTPQQVGSPVGMDVPPSTEEKIMLRRRVGTSTKETSEKRKISHGRVCKIDYENF